MATVKASPLASQRKPLHEVSPQVPSCVNAAAMNGPAILPAPTEKPSIPCHLPRSFSVTMSERIIMERAVIPPLAAPVRPRKTKSMVACWEKPQTSSLTASSTRTDRKTDFLPMPIVSQPTPGTHDYSPYRSDKRPYKTWEIVFAISALVPTQLMVSSA